MDGEFLRAMKNIDKNLKRIADALEKKNAPGGQDQGQGELRNQLTMAFQEEASRLQVKDTGLFQSGEHDADSSLSGGR